MSVLLPATPAAVGIARRIACELPLEAATRDAVALVVSELAANAVEHTRSALIVVDVVVDGWGVLIEVVGDDVDAGAPIARDDPAGLRGRGLLMVSRLAQAWGVRTHDGAPGVWATVAPSADEDPRERSTERERPLERVPDV